MSVSSANNKPSYHILSVLVQNRPGVLARVASLFARRGVLTAAGPFEDARTGSDAELLARLDLLFGRRAIRRDPAILTVQLWREGSLSHVGGRGLFSPERYDYRAAWMDRHLALWRARRLPMPLPAS